MSLQKSYQSFDDNDQPQVTLEEALELARGHHQISNYILAERTYRDILKSYPDHYEANHFLGVLLFQTGNHKDAAGYLEKACALNPKDMNAWNNYGAVLTQDQQFEEAVKAYDSALDENPDYIDALNNKSYALWQMKRYEEAENVAHKTLALDPNNSIALNNLGMALARLQRYEDALDVWEKATGLDPNDASLWSNWGNTLREMNRIASSEEKCRKALEIAPDNVDALNNLANALRDLGEYQQAVDLYKKATDLRPGYHHAHNNLAIALLDLDRCQEAVVAARYAIAFKEDSAEAYSTLSQALCGLSDYQKAHMAAQKALHLDPESASAWMDIAEVLMHVDHHHDGEAALREALKYDPESPRAYMKLAEIRDQMNHKEEALKAIDKAIEVGPDVMVIRLRKAHILSNANRVPEAIEVLDDTIEKAPNFLTAYQMKSEMLISMNRTDEAEEIIRHVINHSHDMPHPYLTLTSLKKFETEDDSDFKAMRDLYKRANTLSTESTAVLNYALSSAYQHMGKYDESFKHLKEANDLKWKSVPYDEASVQIADNKVEEVKKQFSPAVLDKYKDTGHETDEVIFIVGMPRSGTTLTEQILSSHPDVYGAGELTDMSMVVSEIDRSKALDVQTLGRAYIERAREHQSGEKSKYFTDKMPGNFMNIGLISMILPKAKIIHCRRNPIDTCVSCYQQNFARGHYWSYNMEAMAEEYKRYLQVMEYWREVLPGRFYEVDYEETVGNFEGSARKLIEYVGLEWNDACLEPHKQKRTVLTASKAQVTKPVYKTSVAKWKRYEQHVQHLVRELMPEEAL